MAEFLNEGQFIVAVVIAAMVAALVVGLMVSRWMAVYLWIALFSGVTAGPYTVTDCPAWANAIERQWISASGIFPAVPNDWSVRRAYCASRR